jgi:hypothetical protein
VITTGVVEKNRDMSREVWTFLVIWKKSRYNTHIMTINDNEVRRIKAVFTSTPRRFVPSAMKI